MPSSVIAHIKRMRSWHFRGVRYLTFRKHPNYFYLSGNCIKKTKRNGSLNATVTIECRVSKNWFEYNVPLFKRGSYVT